MRIHALIIATLVSLAPIWSSNAFSQARGSGMSAFGSASGMSGFGSSGFGSSFGSSGFGSGFGSSGFGSGFGSSGFGSSSFGNSGFGSSGFGSSGFGSSRGGNPGFIGRDANDMQSIFRQFSRSSTQFFNNANRQMSRANRQRRAATTTTRNPPQPMRMEVHVAFDAPQPTSAAVAKSLEVRLVKIMNDHHMTVPQVSVENGVAVLSGVAQSDNERQVIAQLVSMEPGVRSVRNEMSVSGEPSADTKSPSGS